MSKTYVSSLPLPEFGLWKKTMGKQPLYSFDFELTARCNNNCRHCYVNLPAGDAEAKKRELSLEEIDKIASEAVSLGAFWCMLSGGEPLLREAFMEIYLLLKKKGLLLSIFTNGTLIGEDHVRLFKTYPPRDIEVSVYGVSQETYEQVTRTPGSFKAFKRGLRLLRENGIKFRLKAMALKSNVHEFGEIAAFCRAWTKDYFRFDPFLHLRYDGDKARNEEIRSERLSPEEIVRLERADPERFNALLKKCEIRTEWTADTARPAPLFLCGAGRDGFSLSSEGVFRLCSTLWHPDCIYDLKTGSLQEAWREVVPRVRRMMSGKQSFVKACPSCRIIRICHWCPAVAHLETGALDEAVAFFCDAAHVREKAVSDRASDSRA